MSVVQHALMITLFVLTMMVAIEYVNVQSRGLWQERLRESRWGQLIFGAFLGALPGCLGSFTAVALYAHRAIGFGALVATMIATSGDEAFVLFALVPKQALAITGGLFVVAVVGGALSHWALGDKELLHQLSTHELPLHEEAECQCFSVHTTLANFRDISFPRALLVVLFGGAIFLLGSHMLGGPVWNWKSLTFAGGASFALFVVSTVPDHFLEEHLWNHVIKQHLPRIFLWTFGTLLLLHVVESQIDLKPWTQGHLWLVLVVAVLIGIIPESGPHLIFVTLFAQGALPLPILLANSIVQDGHGTLPLLAVSRRSFVWLKAVNVIAGLAVGAAGLLLL